MNSFSNYLIPELEILKNDEYFKPISGKLDQMLDPSQYTGRAGKQVEEYLRDVVAPITERYKTDSENKKSELNL